jgi:hypothetical protein
VPLTDRQRQVFLHATSGQIENAVLDHYERARKAKTLQGEMYWWTSVFHQNNQRGRWDKTNLSANLVREMLMNGRDRNEVKQYDRIDDIVYGVDKDTEHEIRHSEKYTKGETTMVVHNDDPQMHEYQSNVLIEFLLMVHELVEICEEPELRALAYFLYKTKLDSFFDYFSKEVIEALWEIMLELYEIKETSSLDKQVFIAGTRWYSKKAEESLQEKLRSILP